MQGTHEQIHFKRGLASALRRVLHLGHEPKYANTVKIRVKSRHQTSRPKRLFSQGIGAVLFMNREVRDSLDGRSLLRPSLNRSHHRPRGPAVDRRARRRPLSMACASAVSAPPAAPFVPSPSPQTISHRGNDMPQIGEFTRNQTGYSGRIQTLILKLEIKRATKTNPTSACTPAARTAPTSVPDGSARAKKPASRIAADTRPDIRPDERVRCRLPCPRGAR